MVGRTFVKKNKNDNFSIHTYFFKFDMCLSDKFPFYQHQQIQQLENEQHQAARFAICHGGFLFEETWPWLRNQSESATRLGTTGTQKSQE